MNKPNTREGFISGAEPVDNASVAKTIEHAPAQPEQPDLPELQPEKETWPLKVKLLRKPIRGPKGTELVSELNFREPTGGDINRYGNPCRVDMNGDVIIDEQKMTTMIAVLSGVLQPFIEMMDPRDWNSCAYRLRGFFIPNPAAW